MSNKRSGTGWTDAEVRAARITLRVLKNNERFLRNMKHGNPSMTNGELERRAKAREAILKQERFEDEQILKGR